MGKPTEGPYTACFTIFDGVRVGFHIAAKPEGSVRPVAWGGVLGEKPAVHHWPESELKATAHLLAAAWDMAAALEAIQTKAKVRLEHYAPGDYGDAEFTAILKTAKAALAKSRGEA